MLKITLYIALSCFSVNSYSNDSDESLTLNCAHYSWAGVENLVQPYLDDSLYTALVMQGQSANYKTSAAAAQAIDKSLPESVTKILQALILSDC